LLYGSEASVEPNYRDTVLEDLLYLQRVTPSSRDGLCFLQSKGVTYVYVGEMGGRVGTPPLEPLLAVDQLSSSPAFEMLYSEDRVRIFRLSDVACGP
jgi:hypothetical protein